METNPIYTRGLDGRQIYRDRVLIAVATSEFEAVNIVCAMNQFWVDDLEGIL